MGKRNTGGMNVGTSSVLVAFVLLCLVTFAGLSFLSANSDYRLSLQTAEKTTEYYEAGLKADKKLSEIDEELTELAASYPEHSYPQEVINYFNIVPEISVDDSEEDPVLFFTETINERQDLKVAVRVLYPDTNEGKTFLVKSYNVEVNSSWQDEILNEIDENGLMTFN